MTTHQTDLAHAISHTPMSAYQWLIVALAVILNMLDGFDVLAIAFTAKSIQTELGLTGVQIGTLMSAGFIGMAIGSMGLAPLADKFGRRPLLIIATALSALGMFMTYFSHTTQSIGFWRVITGIGVGGILPCTNVIVSEYANQKWRGLAIAIYACGFGIGAMLGGLSAVMLQDEFGFRSVFMTGAVLTGLALVALVSLLPESVDFLNQKQPANAQTKLTKIAHKIGKQGNWQLPTQNQSAKAKAPISQLFAKGQLKTTLLIWAAFIAVMSSFYFISSWTPALLESSGLAKEQSQKVGMAISIGGTIGSLIFGFLVSKFTPKSTLMAFVVLSSFAIIGFVFSPTLTLALIFAILVGSLVNGCITGLYTINPTLYAPEFRSTGVGMAISIGGTIGSLIFGFLVSKFTPKSTLMAFVVLSSLAIIGFVFSPTLTLALIFAILVGSLVNGCITGLYTINPTLYAPEFRSTGVGTAIGVGRIGSIVSPILAGKLLDMGIGKDDLYLGASGFILLALVALYFLKPNER